MSVIHDLSSIVLIFLILLWLGLKILWRERFSPVPIRSELEPVVDHTEHQLVPVVVGGLLIGSVCSVCHTNFPPSAWIEQGDRILADLLP